MHTFRSLLALATFVRTFEVEAYLTSVIEGLGLDLKVPPKE